MIRELVALKLLLDQDSTDGNRSRLEQRDYEIGLKIKEQPAKPWRKWFTGKEGRKRNKILLWLSHVMDDDGSSEIREKSKTIENGVKWLGVGIVLIGLVLGVSAAAAVFHYDGTTPINILPAIFLFVVLPLAFLIYFIILALRDSKLGEGYFGKSSTKLNRTASPGFIQNKLMNKLSGGRRLQAESEAGNMEKLRIAYTPFVKWKLRYWTQLSAIFYMLGALGWLTLKIATTDLAFSWSTTLNISPNTMNAFTSVIAAPWSAWVPAASIDLETIELTQYYRAGQSALPQGAEASDMGRWWGFLLMAMVCYGLFPRIITLMICDYRTRKGFSHALTTLAGGLPRRLDRVMAPPGRMAEGQTGDSGQAKELASGPVSQPSSIVLEWGNIKPADTFYDHILNGSPDTGSRLFRVGHDTLEADEKVLAGIKEILDKEAEAPDVIIITSSWEPPIADFTLFLKDLLRVTPEDANIIVLPVSYDDDMLRSRYRQDAVQWKSRLNSLGEPRLHVEETNQTLTNP